MKKLLKIVPGKNSRKGRKKRKTGMLIENNQPIT